MEATALDELPHYLRDVLQLSHSIKRELEHQAWDEVERLAIHRQEKLEQFFLSWDKESHRELVIKTLSKLKTEIEQQTDALVKNKANQTAKVIDIRQAHQAAKAYQKNIHF